MALKGADVHEHSSVGALLCLHNKRTCKFHLVTKHDLIVNRSFICITPRKPIHAVTDPLLYLWNAINLKCVHANLFQWHDIWVSRNYNWLVWCTKLSTDFAISTPVWQCGHIIWQFFFLVKLRCLDLCNYSKLKISRKKKHLKMAISRKNTWKWLEEE